MIETTASTNAKAFGKGQSYAHLKSQHFDSRDRVEKGISKDKDLESLNQHFDFISKDEVKNVYDQYESCIKSYNSKPSQIRNPRRCIKDLDAFVSKKLSRKGIADGFHGLEYMAVFKISNMEDWDEISTTFKKYGVVEKDLLSTLNKSFKSVGEYFNQHFSTLKLVEADTNLDEKGSPHMHGRILITSCDKNGMPETNFVKAISSVYKNKKSNRLIMKAFRDDIDKRIFEECRKSLKERAQEAGFSFDMRFIRKKAAVVGKDHDAYIQDAQAKEQIDKLKEEAKKSYDVQKEQLKADRTAFDIEKATFDTEKEQFDTDKEELSNMLKEASSLLEDVKAVKPEDESFKDFLIKDAVMPSDVNRINYKWNKFVESKNETPEQKERKRRLLKLNFNFDGKFIHADSQGLDPEYD